MDEYELAGIEIIARGVCRRDGKVLLCRAVGGKSAYLPGGHVEFGESGREALVREVKEELGVDSSTGKFLGVVENKFMQHGKPHAEVNLVYELELADGAEAVSKESWIEFEWVADADIPSANLLPEQFRRISTEASPFFEA